MSHTAAPGTPQPVFRQIATANQVAIWQLQSAPAVSPFFYMVNTVELDLDGAPNAYGPQGVHSTTANYHGATGPLDSLRNGGAGEQEKVNGVPKPKAPYGYIPQPTPADPWHGRQQAAGDWKGFYISKTALHGDPETGSDSDPDFYVDSTSIPYVALPTRHVKKHPHGPPTVLNQDFANTGIALGDVVLAINAKNGQRAFAIYADTKIKRHVSEISPKLVEMLGMPIKIKHGRVVCNERHPSIVYVAFPGSGRGQGNVPGVNEIQNLGAAALNKANDAYQLADRVPDRYPSMPLIRSAFLGLGTTHVPLKFLPIQYGKGQCW